MSTENPEAGLLGTPMKCASGFILKKKSRFDVQALLVDYAVLLVSYHATVYDVRFAYVVFFVG